ncbi:hypothetical protein C6497_02690 [Candidatus Poribacteria bacterium]|nr:MAG: hypothetical protein C6497_02690 [Candidatus Poribacteria bacterium]
MRKNIVAMSNLTDEELIQHVQNRDQDAFSELITRWTPRIKGVVRSNSRHKLDAEEIHTDIWVAVWQNIIHLRNIESFGAWLHRIAFNTCKRYYTLTRQSRNEIPHEHSVIVEQIEQQAAARYREKQLMADIKEAIHHLPQKVRSVAELFYLESWHIKEIAVECNLPIGTVKTKLKEIRTLLRKEFDAEVTKGVSMTSKIVQPKNTPTKTHTGKTSNNRRPAIFNVNPNEPTGESWGAPEGLFARFGKGEVKSVELSPDGSYFAMSTILGLWWYDVATMKPISLWDHIGRLVVGINFSPDGKWVILSNVTPSVKVVEVETGETVFEMEDQNAYAGLACSSNGKWVAVADQEGHVRVLDIHTGKQIAQMDRGEHKWKTNDIEGLTFTPDGSLLASMVRNHKKYSKDNEVMNPDDEDEQIYVWDPETGKPVVKFAGNTFEISQDSRLIAGASTDGTLTDDELLYSDVAVWDIATSEQITYFTEHSNWINSIAFSPCRKYIASEDETLLVWEIATGTVQKLIPNVQDPFYSNTGQLYAIRYPNKTEDAPGFTNYTVDVWNVETNEKTLEVCMGVGNYWFSYDIAKAYTNKLIELSADENRTNNKGKSTTDVPMFDVVHELSFLHPGPEIAWLDDHNLVALSFDGLEFFDIDKTSHKNTHYFYNYVSSFVVMPSSEIRVILCHHEERHKTWRIRTHDQPITKIPLPDEVYDRNCGPEFSPMGDRIAVGCEMGNIYVWNITDPDNPLVLKGHTDDSRVSTFSPDGQRLISYARDEPRRLWDLESCQEIDRLEIENSIDPIELVYSPCGKFIAAELRTEIRIYDAEDFTPLRSIPQTKPHYWRTTPLVFSPCSRFIAGATWWEEGYDNLAVRIWNIETCEQVGDLRGHGDLLVSLAFSPNGKLLSAGCMNGTIVLWEVGL